MKKLKALHAIVRVISEEVVFKKCKNESSNKNVNLVITNESIDLIRYDRLCKGIIANMSVEIVSTKVTTFISHNCA